MHEASFLFFMIIQISFSKVYCEYITATRSRALLILRSFRFLTIFVDHIFYYHFIFLGSLFTSFLLLMFCSHAIGFLNKFYLPKTNKIAKNKTCSVCLRFGLIIARICVLQVQDRRSYGLWLLWLSASLCGWKG